MPRLTSQQPTTVSARLIDCDISKLTDEELQQKIELLRGAAQMASAPAKRGGAAKAASAPTDFDESNLG